jgi:hypothetical protein
VLVSSPIWSSCPDIYYSLTVTVLFLWGALSDERTGLSFVYAAGPRQRSLFRVRVPWISRPYFTVSVLTLPFSSPPTTRRATVEVFDPASTRVCVAEEAEAYCRQPAGTLSPGTGPRWDPWPYICSMSRPLLFLFSLSLILLIDKEGLVFYICI